VGSRMRTARSASSGSVPQAIDCSVAVPQLGLGILHGPSAQSSIRCRSIEQAVLRWPDALGRLPRRRHKSGFEALLYRNPLAGYSLHSAQGVSPSTTQVLSVVFGGLPHISRPVAEAGLTTLKTGLRSMRQFSSVVLGSAQNLLHDIAGRQF